MNKALLFILYKKVNCFPSSTFNVLIILLPNFIIQNASKYLLTHRLFQSQLRDRRPRSAYDDDDDDDDDLDNRPSYQRAGRGRTKRSNGKNVWWRAKMLLQPTSDWGPAARNSSTPSRTLTHTPSPGNQRPNQPLVTRK